MPDTLNIKGGATRRDEAAWLALALLLAADFADAHGRWNRFARASRLPLLVGLLGAVAVDDLEQVPPAARVFFVRSTLLYGRRVDGELVYIRPSTIRRALGAYAESTEETMAGLGRQVATGRMSIAEWQDAMTAEIRGNQAVMTGLGAGGTGNVDESDVAIARGRVRYQLERLDRFARQIERGQTLANSVPAITQRSGSYATTAVTTYHAVLRNAATAAFTQERRVLGAAEHCGTCVREAARGWVSIGELREIGDSECGANCHCYFDYRRKTQD